MDEKLIARAKLIYERDHNSPLFLRAADYYLQINDPQTAVSILENGLKIFPDHPLAFLLLGKAKYALGKYESAKSLFLRASEIINSGQTFTHYKNEFNLTDKPTSPFDTSRGSIFINSTEDFVVDDEIVDDQSKSIENNLKQIAEKLINARMNQNNKISFNENNLQGYNQDKSKLATETFANIYLSQGQKTEAIKIYELLADRYPEKKDYYLEKIRMLKSQ